MCRTSFLTADTRPCVLIKVEQTEMEVKIEKSQVVWTAFPGTSMQLRTADKSLIQDSCKLSDKHINFAQAILKALFPQCEGYKTPSYKID